MTKRCWAAIIGTCAIAFSYDASAASVEHTATAAWWSKRGNAAEGNPVIGFALPVMSGDRMVGTLQLVCPRQSERGAFFEIPMTIVPGGELQGKSLMTILAINSQTFAGYVDNNRFLVYLNAVAPPPLPGMKPGTSVRGALLEAKGTILIRTDPTNPTGVMVKPTLTDQSVPALINRLRGQGLQPSSLEQALKECDAFMKGGR